MKLTIVLIAAVKIATLSAVQAGGFLRSSVLTGIINDALNGGVSGEVDNGSVPAEWFLKFSLDGVGTERWNTTDIDAFDRSVQAAYNTVHGEQDGYFWAGQKEKKIKRRNGVLSMSSVTHVDDGDLGTKKSKTKTRKYFYDVYSGFDYTCVLCRNDDADLVSASILDRDSPGLARLPEVADKVCLYLSKWGDDTFGDVHDCTIEVLTEEDVAMAGLDDPDDDTVTDIPDVVA